MTDILVTFHPDVAGQRQDEILAQVEQWPGVTSAAPIKRDAPESFRRFSYARVDEEHATGVTEALKELPEVENAELAPRRGL